MIRKTLSVGFENLKHIHHFADIHIRNLKRHKEYRQVFQKVYSKLKENRDNSIIVLAGDIVHAKLDMSPELIELTSEFFTKLAKIAPLVVIPGNHDWLDSHSLKDIALGQDLLKFGFLRNERMTMV